MHGWDLGDLYRGEMSLRGVWVRIKALPRESPLFLALAEAREEYEERMNRAAEEEALALFNLKG